MRQLLLLFLLAASPGYADTIRFHGSNTIGAALMPNLIEAWLPEAGYRIEDRLSTSEGEYAIVATDSSGKQLTIEIASHGSSTAFRALASGRADIGMSSRRVRDQEAQQLLAQGDLTQPEHEWVLALDAVAVIVHPDNPVMQLSLSQVSDLFTGRTGNWQSINGENRSVNVYARDDRSGTYEVFRQLALDKAPLAASARRFESSDRLVQAVASDPGAIGFVSLAYSDAVHTVAIREGEVAVSATPFQVATEDFPLARRLYLYVPDQSRTPLIENLLQFALSPRGQEIAAQSGYVSQNVFAAPLAPPPGAPGDYRDLTAGAQRLSLNFRFDEREIQLDAKAQRDLDRLAEYLRQRQQRPDEIMLLGFADPDEALPTVSLELASRRADYVSHELLNRGIAATRVRGYGSAVAIADNSHPRGRLRNRRVEVWIR